MKWEQVASDFAWDGSWRDIYVLNTSEADWQRVWDILREWSPPANFSVSGNIESMLLGVEAALESETASLLSFYVGPIQLACHFFSTVEIEFDFDPRQVSGIPEVEQLEGFMRLLGDAIEKQVILTQENDQEAIIARYSPDLESVVWTALS
ncbi:MAG: hypothetical protein EOS58_18635 [Mesorhizobium sp.]|nr:MULTISPECIES: hypothetical protein [unclassified Mesorhizobium]AZO47963.1 hypothetical protein EJ073_09150 [Mesorhizobium sp. M4B.F.Ca.ET.058.02.1.1]RUX43839.1 hypothetical protein EOA33_28290 [Mesorhizobium sp. M4A.F.Ca.ET.050.02.1.1]RVD37842.1 hypothetical protein EN742_19200 [Mesorhizobium sp. M4A.F.Ca.ET.020.02.1.1]RWC11475.1 MAG: hypothetical protein EOS53_27360 [Mesorhizobium sp.]RWC49691.1 MAG: hypothetical protein EOS54_22115 [Mesorhizobium sp.]